MHFHMTSKFVEELDCMLSLALVSHQYMYARPVLTAEDSFEIKKKEITHFL